MLREYLASSATVAAPTATPRSPTTSPRFPPTSVNVILQVGHNTLRLMTAGLDNRPLTPGELATMERLLEEALAAGAWGLSSGLFTAPGNFADAAEIHALARVLRRHGAPRTPRTCATRRITSSRRCGRPSPSPRPPASTCRSRTSSSPAWTTGAARPGSSRRSRPRGGRGVPVDCDAYPYDTATNPLRNLLPRWVMEGGIPAMLERLRSRDVRTRIREEIARSGLPNFGRIPSWDVVRVAISPHMPENAGRTLGDIARARGVDPIDAFADYVVADHGETRILITAMTDADVHEITRAPWVTVGSDGNSLAVTGVTGQGKPHPRYYGTHAHILGPCVRDLRLFTLETAVAKMTGVAARALGLRDRGLLRTGAWADVAVFDPARIADRSTYEEPHRYAVGISTVVVNGEVVIDGGDHTGALPGRVLRRPAESRPLAGPR